MKIISKLAIATAFAALAACGGGGDEANNTDMNMTDLNATTDMNAGMTDMNATTDMNMGATDLNATGGTTDLNATGNTTDATNATTNNGM
jgi:hypothetical protein